jgi:hypothetical protein
MGAHRWLERQSGPRLFLILWASWSAGWAVITVAVCLLVSASSHHRLSLPPAWIFAVAVLGFSWSSALLTKLIRQAGAARG